jgi:chitosanase
MQQKTMIQQIVNVFETGKLEGDYSCITNDPGDLGGLSYGKQQVTLNGGNLYVLLNKYIENGGSYSEQLSPFMDRIKSRDKTLNEDCDDLVEILKAASNDEIMIKTQDQVFDTVYWDKAFNEFKSNFEYPLTMAVIYDSLIHGSFSTVRQGIDATDEKSWTQEYVTKRRNWLADHKNKLLHKTVYRMDTFQKLIDADNWQLESPITVQGVVISGSNVTLQRTLKLENPLMHGIDVVKLQEKLKLTFGYEIGDIDGYFGDKTRVAVKNYQFDHKLEVDGVAGPKTLKHIGL